MSLFDLPPPQPPRSLEVLARCRRCNRPIRDPVSLGYRIGPECRHRLGIEPPRKPPRIGVRWTGSVEGQQDLTKINERNAMNEISYHEAHAPYIEAVAGALTSAGIHVESWHANPDDPRNGAVILRDDETGETAIVWGEEDGWAYGTGPGGGRLGSVRWICDELLPEPAAVADAVRRILARDYTQASLNQSWYRDFEEEDGFEERLAAYHPKAKAESGEGKGR